MSEIKQEFERNNKLAEHISGMAASGRIGNSHVWNDFLNILNGELRKSDEENESLSNLMAKRQKAMQVMAEKLLESAATIERMEKESEWISVEDRLPEIGSDVLVYMEEYKAIAVDQYDEWFEQPLPTSSQEIKVGEGFMQYGIDEITEWKLLCSTPER